MEESMRRERRSYSCLFAGGNTCEWKSPLFCLLCEWYCFPTMR